MIAQDVLAERFPQARGAILAGSAARGQDTPTSDLDLVVLLPGPPAPMRTTERHYGRLVEFFVHTEDSLKVFLDREQRLRRSPLLHMLAFGAPITDRHGELHRLQQLARHRWDAGPDPLADGELDDRRYRLTTLLDDLTDTTEPGERISLAAAVFADVADLALISRGHWTGTGRWLVRQLRELDASLAEELLAGLSHAVNGDPELLLTTGRSELNRLGGPLDDGYERRA